MTFEELIELNNKKIEEYKKQNNEAKILLHEKIAKLLEDNPALFFENDMESCLKILAQILPEDKIKEAYTSLISPDKFEELIRKFKI